MRYQSADSESCIARCRSVCTPDAEQTLFAATHLVLSDVWQLLHVGSGAAACPEHALQ